MIIREEILRVILSHYPGWSQSPVGLLTMIKMVELSVVGKDVVEGRTANVARQLADALLKETNINIAPFNSFNEILEICEPEPDYPDRLQRLLAEYRLETKIYAQLDDAGVLPSEDTMKSEALSTLMTRQLIDRLRPYVYIAAEGTT